MNRRNYKISIFENGNRSHLSVEVFSNSDISNKGYLFRVKLMNINLLEVNLNNGRFMRYCEDDQPWKSSLQLSEMDFEERVNWIYRYVKCKWSFSIDMPNVHMGTMTFSFENVTEAIHFRLAF